MNNYIDPRQISCPRLRRILRMCMLTTMAILTGMVDAESVRGWLEKV